MLNACGFWRSRLDNCCLSEAVHAFYRQLGTLLALLSVLLGNNVQCKYTLERPKRPQAKSSHFNMHLRTEGAKVVSILDVLSFRLGHHRGLTRTSRPRQVLEPVFLPESSRALPPFLPTMKLFLISGSLSRMFMYVRRTATTIKSWSSRGESKNLLANIFSEAW